MPLKRKSPQRVLEAIFLTYYNFLEKPIDIFKSTWYNVISNKEERRY